MRKSFIPWNLCHVNGIMGNSRRFALGGFPAQRYGRKTLFWIGVLYLISALGSALAPDPFTFPNAVYRWPWSGASSVAVPYISEISTARTRGQFVALYQFNIVFGIFIAFLSNYLLDGVGGLLTGAICCILKRFQLLFIVYLFCEFPSPRWLILTKKDDIQGLRILQFIYSEQEAEQFEGDQRRGWKMDTTESLSKKYSRVLTLAFYWPFNQWSGINFVLYYA